MSLKPKIWSYRNQHCAKQCLLSRTGKMCQCKFDRRYENEQKKKVKNE